jgi:hypothetical protein
MAQPPYTLTSAQGEVLAPPGARHSADRSWAEENWENEGGHLPGFSGVNCGPTMIPRLAGEAESFAMQIRTMEAIFSRDFANGRVGTRYNTYQHRSRVVRQLTAKLHAMRAREAGFQCRSIDGE